MDQDSKEGLKKSIKGELRIFAREPFIIQNENPLWVMECARVLGHRFSFVVRGKDSYLITISAERMYEIFEELDLLFMNPKFEYHAHDFIDHLRKELGQARIQCEGIIRCFQNRAEDERKVLEERLQLEAEYRYNNNRRY